MEKKIAFFSGGRDFMLPYMQREFPGQKAIVNEDFNDADAAVLLSSVDIYVPDSESALDEDAPVTSDSEWKRCEDDFLSEAQRRGLRAFVLRCAPVVGTGMNGYVRHLAEDIARGVFMHFPDNDAKVSAVHASDVARAAKMLVDSELQGGVFNITDGCDPTIHDLAEALAFRMNNKRISNISTRPQQIIARILYGRRRMQRYTRTALFSSQRLQAAGFDPVPVCEYMRTHVYDDSSL